MLTRFLEGAIGRPKSSILAIVFDKKIKETVLSSDTIAQEFYNYRAVLRSLEPEIQQLTNGEFQVVHELSD